MRYRVELLQNGLIRVFDYACKWAGLYNPDGTRRGFGTEGMDRAVRRSAISQKGETLPPCRSQGVCPAGWRYPKQSS